MQLSGGTQRLGGLSDAALSAEIPIRHLAKARFSGAALIARALDPSEGALFQVISSSRQKDLPEIIRQTLGPDRERRIQQEWGRGYEELAAVFCEQDAELFYQSFFQVAQGLESGSLGKAALVYAVLARAGQTAPKPSANEETNHSANLVLANLAKRAHRRFQVITEGGSSWESIAFSLANMPAQFSRLDWMFAMAGGQIVFRGAQALATARFAKTFESAWVLNGVAAGTGLLAESVAFTGLATATGALPGGPEAIAKNWAGAATMLVGFRALHGTFGKLSGNWAVGENAFARWTRAVTPNAGMLAGALAYGKVAHAMDLPTPSSGGNSLINAATMMVTAKLAGRIQSQFAGPSLNYLEVGAKEYAGSVFALRQGRALALAPRLSTGVVDGTDPQFRPSSVGTDPQYRVGTDLQFRTLGMYPQFRPSSVGTDPQYRVGTDPQFRIRGTDGIHAGLVTFLPAGA